MELQHRIKYSSRPYCRSFHWKMGGMFPNYELQGYSILFLCGFLLGMGGLYFISKIPEPPIPSRGKKVKILDLITRPFKDSNFKRLIMFLGSWNFAIFLAAPFFTVYLLQRLNYNMSVVIAFTVLTQITNVLFFQVWGGSPTDIATNRC